tara:strand:+ start:5157 stop:5849 length:693 start_codon:yes stop_codon:yes gene_type:complete
MLLGQAVHAMCLEGEGVYKQRFAHTSTKIDRRTKAGKEEWAAFELSSKGKSVISFDDHQTTVNVCESIKNHPAASDLLMSGTPETAIRWELEDGLYGKGIIDMLPQGDGPIVDLKTTRDASPSGFAKQIANYRYNGQACYYRRAVSALEGAPRRDFVIIAVEVEAPYCVGVYRLNADAIDSGERMVDMCLDRWLAATRGQQGFAPHYTDYIEDLGIPMWAMADENSNVVA